MIVNKSKTVISFLKTMVFLLVTSILFKILVFELYYVPSESMERTLFPGDYLYVNKIAYGPRLPRTFGEIPWIEVLVYLCTGRLIETNTALYNNLRIKGFSTIKKGDIIVFNNPINPQNYLVKRCVAEPHDILNIYDGKVLVDSGNPYTPLFAEIPYSVIFRTNNDYNKICAKYGITLNEDWGDRISLKKNIVITFLQASQLRNDPGVESVTEEKKPIHANLSLQFKLAALPERKSIVVPFFGYKIYLDSNTFIKYRSIILNYERQQFYKKGNLVYDNHNCLIKEYVFKHDYYFMMGDNRNNSIDSRYWGLLPDYDVVGKVSLVLYSTSSNVSKWSRLFKFIH